MIDRIDCVEDVWIQSMLHGGRSRLKNAEKGQGDYLGKVMARLSLWNECQQKALREFNRIVLGDPGTYGIDPPGNVQRGIARAARTAREEYLKSLRAELGI